MLDFFWAGIKSRQDGFFNQCKGDIMSHKMRRTSILGGLAVGFLLVTSLISSGPAGCGSGGGDEVEGQFDDLEITSTETSGALSMGGTVDVNADGNLEMVLNAIPNPDSPTTPFGVDDLDFTENFTEAAATLIVDGEKLQVDFSCTVAAVGEGAVAPADIVFVLDTTGSMGTTITSVKTSIIEFADAISDVLDVRFALVTFGDKVNTDNEGGCKRRFMNFSGSTSAESATALQTFIETADNGVVACGGVGATENAFGAVNTALSVLSFREKVSRVFIVITDITTHVKEGAVTREANGDDVDPLPPTIDALRTSLEGAAVFTITNDPSDTTDTTEDGTTFVSRLLTGGGINISLGSGTFNLGDLPLTTFLSSGYRIVCRPPDICTGRPQVNGTIECTATDSTGRSGTVSWVTILRCGD